MLIFMISLIVVIYLLMSDDSTDASQKSYALIKCSSCGNDIGIDFNYCPKCKEILKRECNNCRRMIDINWRNCPYCEQFHK